MAAQIPKKFYSYNYIHLSKVSEVYSDQGCMTYFHGIVIVSFLVTSDILLLLKYWTNLL